MENKIGQKLDFVLWICKKSVGQKPCSSATLKNYSSHTNWMCCVIQIFYITGVIPQLLHVYLTLVEMEHVRPLEQCILNVHVITDLVVYFVKTTLVSY